MRMHKSENAKNERNRLTTARKIVKTTMRKRGRRHVTSEETTRLPQQGGDGHS